jgi:hypothetical protein
MPLAEFGIGPIALSEVLVKATLAVGIAGAGSKDRHNAIVRPDDAVRALV